MKADLRIGNLAKIENDLLPETKNRIFTVTGIQERTEKDFPNSDSVISLSCEGSWKTYNQFNEFIEPIRLTEEWLLKFGFVGNSLTGMYVCYKLGYFKIWHDNKNDTFLIDNIKEIKLFIKYVHSLQNLFYALSGEELIIKKA